MKIYNPRVPQTTNNLRNVQTALWDALFLVAKTLGTPGIVSEDGADVDNSDAPVSLAESSTSTISFDVAAGSVVFPTGEILVLSDTDIQGFVVDDSTTATRLVTLRIAAVDAGNVVTNPYYNLAAQPLLETEAPVDMVVLLTQEAYSGLSAEVLSRTVVIGAVQRSGSVLTIDNSRDTFSFSRPWFSAADVYHRSRVGSGVVSDANPHGTPLSALSEGSYTVVQASGIPPGVLARPQSYGRIPGLACDETLLAGDALTDSTGLITGFAGATYWALGNWPERLLSAALENGTPVAAWIPKGHNVLAVYDPVFVASPATLDVSYTKVVAGALPASLLGTSQVEMGDASEEELVVAGGVLLSSLSERSVTFTDVGLVPMAFDIQVGKDGKCYKRPQVLYCNTRLDNIGTSAAPTILQPKQPSRLRVALANYAPAMVEVRLQVTGKDEDGANITEQVVFEADMPNPVPSPRETPGQRKFTANVYASITNVQSIVRNGDGPNTTFTLFAEYSPERPTLADDALLATVQWTGTEVSANYANDANIALDRRNVMTGGTKGALALNVAGNMAMQVETGPVSGLPDGVTKWATIVEDFTDPQWLLQPGSDDLFSGAPVELPSNSQGIRWGYESRKVPFASAISLTSSNTSRCVFMRLLGRNRWAPNAQQLTVDLTLHSVVGIDVPLVGTCSSPWPPYPLVFTGTLLSDSYYAATVKISDGTSGNKAILDEIISGFILHVHD